MRGKRVLVTGGAGFIGSHLVDRLLMRVARLLFWTICRLAAEYLPIDEVHRTRPISPYAASKLATEHYCEAFQHAYGLETVIFRVFNVYGPRQRDGVVAHFIQNLKDGNPPIIYGDGRQTRDFLYVQDAVNAIVLALNHNDAVGQVFNIGTGKATTINELAWLLIRIFGRKLKPLHMEPRRGDVRQSYADIGKAETARRGLEYVGD